MSTQRRAKVKYLKDADGRTLCSCGCGRHPVKPRINWFGEACVQKWRERNDLGYIRRKVGERDHGICAICQCDTEALRQQYRRALVEQYEQGPHRQHWKLTAETIERMSLRGTLTPPDGFPGLERSWWDADHIIPVVEGGGECTIENLRTLCIPCHKKVTRELHARLKAKRRAERTVNISVDLPANE